ncbi:zinc finger protein 700-like [Topomyia yanbarensis]|uniref:zinc finger protein 700-like n=1 Tax=Topomyia yanbarensis TaxID=2498891 RepID=UPI00273B91A5|nr:zinc finger protein 700-like [Topomyia yanbarensis]
MDNADEQIPSPLAVLIKEEPNNDIFAVEVCLKEEPDSSLSEDDQDPIPVASSRQQEHGKDLCSFCLKVLVADKRVQFAPGRDSVQRKKIEFALSIELSGEPECCYSCWQMIELFNNFKRSCYMALFKPEELLGKTTPALGSFTIVKATASEGTPQQSATEEFSIAKLAQEVQSLSEETKLFGCKQCGKQFVEMLSLTKHKNKCNKLKLGKESCHLCPTICRNRSELRTHVRSHSGEKPFKCQTEGCNKSFFYKEVCNVHEQKCGKTKYFEPVKCKHCDTMLTSAKHVRAHTQVHKEPSFECKICKRKFIQRNRLKTHWTTHFRNEIEAAYPESNNLDITEGAEGQIATDHERPDDDTSPMVAVNQSSNEAPDNKVHVCDWCGRFFLGKRGLATHKIRCTRPNKPHFTNSTGKCPHCPAVFNDQQSYQYHVDRHNGIRSALCRNEGCTKAYFNVRARYHHEQTCGKNSRFICNVCGASLKTEGSLRIHMANHGDPQFTCTTCAKKFHTRAALKKHLSVHSDERKHECKVCGKKFKSHEANRVHQRIHTQEKPYACHICDQRFTYNCLLKTHLQKGHGETVVPNRTNSRSR